METSKEKLERLIAKFVSMGREATLEEWKVGYDFHLRLDLRGQIFKRFTKVGFDILYDEMLDEVILYAFLNGDEYRVGVTDDFGNTTYPSNKR